MGFDYIVCATGSFHIPIKRQVYLHSMWSSMLNIPCMQ